MPDKLHNTKIYNLYTLSYMVRMIKSSKMKWAVHAACKERRKMSSKF